MTPSKMLLSLCERAGLLFFCFDLKAEQFTYTNPAFNDFFDLDDDVLEASTLLERVHPDDREYITSKITDCIHNKPVGEFECRIVRGEHSRWLKISPYLHTSTNEEMLYGYAEDINAYKLHDDTLNTHNEKKNAILNILTHDLAGPIGFIQNVADMLNQETKLLNNSKVTEYIATIENISKSCVSLIQDFVNNEFLETAGVKVVKRRIELVGKINSVVQQYVVVQKHMQMQFNCQANKETIYAEIDEDKFMQVINNLLSNALKFTPDGGSITINVEEEDTDILIAVADTGIGIPQQYHARLFDKFSEARRDGLRGEQSRGLGMSIIKTILEWHDGKISFKSEEGKGTTFYIRLPKAE